MLFSCKSHFQLEKTTHRKVVVNESSNAEFINVYLRDVPDEIEFQSIIYNRTQLDVSVEDVENNGKKVTAVKQNGGPLIVGKDEEQTSVDKPNQLVYMKNGKEHSVLLEDIEFLPTKLTGN